MLDFRPDENQQMLLDAVGRFADARLRPIAREVEEAGVIPAGVVRDGWALGWLAAALPEAYGGFGEHDAVTGALVVEALAQGDLALAARIGTPHLLAVPVMLAGTSAQQAAYLPACAGDAPPSYTAALTEPVVQFDPRALATSATRTADGYVLHGVKSVVPAAAAAETILVWANDDGRTQGFFVAADAPGVTIGPRDRLMGLGGLDTYRVTLDGVAVTSADRLGGADGCDFDAILNRSRVAVAAAAVGVADAAATYARQYALQRVQFGRPIAQNQSIAFLLADMASDVKSMRLLVWETAWLIDQGRDATPAATVMKHYVDQAVVRVADGAVQTLGGYGYIREYPAELHLRNARGFASFDGLLLV